MLEKMRPLAEKGHPEVVELRRHFHMNPEIAWNEVKTTEKVEEILQSLGFENIQKGFGGTMCGVTADLTGSKPGPCVALRADMDALPLQEENEVSYCSQNKGVMHACGHDAHTAMLLGAAKVLSQMKDELAGKVRFIFQPAEEHGLKSGADHMVREGVLEGVDVVFGIHVRSSMPTGKIALRSGPTMASCDAWEAVIKGKGGHGAEPDQAVDPTVPAGHVITSLQSIIGREINSQETSVISLGKIEAGSAFNIIPESVKLLGTCRTFRPEVQDMIEEKLGRLIKGISESFRCTSEYVYKKYVPSVINDPEAIGLAKKLGDEIFGNGNVIETSLEMASEDFSYFQQKVPGAFGFLGTAREEKGSANPHHSPLFDVDEDALLQGTQMLAGFALSWKDYSRKD